MSLTNLNAKRQLLFTALDELKSNVGTDSFISGIELAQVRGFEFAVETGLLSKDETLQIEELFSTTILTKSQVISELRRIFGLFHIDFGPGPQSLIGGDMTNGYFGEVSAEELFTGNQLATQLDITQGISLNSGAGWLKFARHENIVFIAKRPLRRRISWDHLYSKGLVYGSDDIGFLPGSNPINQKTILNLNDSNFICRLISGVANKAHVTTIDGVSTSDVDSCLANFGNNSEWQNLMYRIHEDIPTCPNGETSDWGPQIGENWATFTDADLGFGGSLLGRVSWFQEYSESNTNERMGQGNRRLSNMNWGDSSLVSDIWGWRPVLALQQKDGSYSTGTEHYPE